jgi:hypothetical protein
LLLCEKQNLHVLAEPIRWERQSKKGDLEEIKWDDKGHGWGFGKHQIELSVILFGVFVNYPQHGEGDDSHEEGNEYKFHRSFQEDIFHFPEAKGNRYRNEQD